MRFTLKQFKALVLATALGAFGVGVISGQATADPKMNRFPAVVKCGTETLAEDSAAHVKLVGFKRNDDGTTTVVYKCLKTGY